MGDVEANNEWLIVSILKLFKKNDQLITNGIYFTPQVVILLDGIIGHQVNVLVKNTECFYWPRKVLRAFLPLSLLGFI